MKWYVIYSNHKTMGVAHTLWVASFQALNAKCALRLAKPHFPKGTPLIARVYRREEHEI